MSSNFVTPGQAYDHDLLVTKGLHPDYPVDARGRFAATVDFTVIIAHAGRVVYQSDVNNTANVSGNLLTGRGPGVPVFRMGRAGFKGGPPFWMWNGAYDPSVSNKGTPSGVAAVGASTYVAPWVSALPGRAPDQTNSLWVLSGIAPLKLETTEYDAAQTYAVGDFLRAVTLDNNANGGVVTNQNASGGAALATTTSTFTLLAGAAAADTVVGYVADKTYNNAYDRGVLSLWTYFLPGTR